MEFLITLFLMTMNTGLMVGLISLVCVLLRPVCKRLFTAQQRVWIWAAAWFLGYIPIRRVASFLPVTFQDLVIPRTGGLYSSAPAILPGSYEGPGAYHVALPGGALVEVSLTDGLMKAVMVVWLLGIAALLVFFWRRHKSLLTVAHRGRKLELTDPLLAPYPWIRKKTSSDVDVWVSSELPSSFLRAGLPWEYDTDYEICLQAELPREQMELVLRHEMSHLELWHTRMKGLASTNIVLFWWNPLVWLGFRYFCQDMELACDAAVLEKLEPAKRKKYAETLVELGRGRPLLEVPLAFGECDAEIRVRAVVDWKPRSMALAVLTWALTVCVILFFFGGGQNTTYFAEDFVLANQRVSGDMEEFRTELNRDLAIELGLATQETLPTRFPDLGITQVWEAPEIHHEYSLPEYHGHEVEYKHYEKEIPGLWVQTGEGDWYLVGYGVTGKHGNNIYILCAEQCPAPDLTDSYQLVG